MFHTIECDQLNLEDTYFLMSYPLRSEKILKSVGTIGVVQPIVVSGCACHGGYQVISGFRRAYACRQIGVKVVNVNIYQVDPEHSLGAFSLALHENVSHRTFNDVEKSLILTKLLHQFHSNRTEVIQTYMPLLGLAPNNDVLDIYLNIIDFEDQIKGYIAEHEVPMTVIELLINLSSEDRNAVFNLMSTLKLGVNKIREFLTSLEEIALRDSCSIYDVLKDSRIGDILNHEKYTEPQKAEQIRRIIREKRYPHLTTIENTYQQQLKQLHLPNGLQLKADRSFEDDSISATFHFSSLNQIKMMADELLKLSQKAELQNMLTLLQGKEH